jgi:superfamily II DNA or RNA helicase
MRFVQTIGGGLRAAEGKDKLIILDHAGNHLLLPCTYRHFEEYGVHANMIGAALRELEALGFVVTTERGAGGNADQQQRHRKRP